MASSASSPSARISTLDPFVAEGEDAELAINALKGLIDRKFDEEP